MLEYQSSSNSKVALQLFQVLTWDTEVWMLYVKNKEKKGVKELFHICVLLVYD